MPYTLSFTLDLGVSGLSLNAALVSQGTIHTTFRNISSTFYDDRQGGYEFYSPAIPSATQGSMVFYTGTIATNAISLTGLNAVTVYSRGSINPQETEYTDIAISSRLAPTVSGRTLVVDVAGLADTNVVKLGPTGAGTAQTARDIGLSVLLSTGTGTGQLDFTSGVVKANATQLLGTTIPTPTVAGIPNVNVKTWNDITTGILPLIPTVANRTLDVTSTGEAGIDWNNIGAPTTSQTFTNTTIANLTNAPTTGDFTTAMKVSLSASAISDKTGYRLSATGVQDVWDAQISAFLAAGSIGKRIGDDLDTSISSRTAWTDLSANLTTVGSIGKKIADNLDAPITSRLAPGGTLATVTSLTNAPTVGDFTSTMKTSLNSLSALDAAISSRLAPSGTLANVTTVANLTNAPTVGDFTSTMKTSLNSLSALDATISSRLAPGGTLANVTTVANLTNAATVGDFTSTMKTSLNSLSALDATISSRLAPGGTLATVTNLTNAATVGDFTSTMKTSLNSLSALDATISSRLAPGGTLATVTNLTNAPTNGDFTSTMKVSLNALSAVNAIAVWDLPLSGHTISGSTGGSLNSAGATGDPWSAIIPGSYGAGTAGNIVGVRVDAAISSRLAPGGTLLNVTNLTNAASAGDFTTTMKTSLNSLSALDVAISSRLAPGGTLLNVTNLTNAATTGDFTTTMKTSLNALSALDATISSRLKPSDTLSRVTFLSNASEAGDFTPTMKTSLNSLSALDATISSRLAPGGTLATVTNLTNAPTNGDFTTTMKTSLNSLSALDAQISSRLAPGGTLATVTNLTNAPTVGDFTTTMKTSLNALSALDATISSRLAPGGTLAIVTNLTNAPTNGDFTSTMKTSLNTSLNPLSALDATISSRLAPGGTLLNVTNLTNAPTTGDFTPIMKSSLNALSATNAIAVWDLPLSGHTTSGSTGGSLNASGASGDPWSASLPGSYGVGTAGNIVGVRVDAAISSRSTYTGTDTSGTTTLLTRIPSNLTITTGKVDVNDKTGFSLSLSGIQGIWDVLNSAQTTVNSIGKRIVDFLTGDIFGRIGAPVGATISADISSVKLDTNTLTTNYTPTRASKLDNLDATVSSRSIYAGTDTPGVGTLLSRIASTLVITGGKIDVNDKTGFSLTQAFPVNFSNLAVDSGGRVTVGAMLSSVTETIATTVERHLLDEGDSQMLVNAIVGAIGNVNIDQVALIAAIRSDLERSGGSIFGIKAKTDILPADPASNTVVNTRASQTSMNLLSGAVWNEPLSQHLIAGSTGDLLNAAGEAADPWTSLIPGGYGIGTAGRIVGQNLDVAVSSRLAPGGTLATVTNVTSAVNVANKTGFSLTAPYDPAKFAPPLSAISTQMITDHGSGSYIRNTEPDNASITLIKAKTDNLPSDPASNTVVNTRSSQTSVNTLQASVTTGFANVSAGSGSGGATASEIAIAVWDESISSHLSASDSTGSRLNAAGSAGDPWSTILPGTYTTPQAGALIAKLNVGEPTAPVIVLPEPPADFALCRVFGNIETIDNQPAIDTTITFKLLTKPTGVAIKSERLIDGRTVTIKTDSKGKIENSNGDPWIDLQRNDLMTPAGSTYLVVSDTIGLKATISLTTDLFDLATIVH